MFIMKLNERLSLAFRIYDNWLVEHFNLVLALYKIWNVVHFRAIHKNKYGWNGEFCFIIFFFLFLFFSLLWWRRFNFIRLTLVCMRPHLPNRRPIAPFLYIFFFLLQYTIKLIRQIKYKRQHNKLICWSNQSIQFKTHDMIWWIHEYGVQFPGEMEFYRNMLLIGIQSYIVRAIQNVTIRNSFRIYL